VSRKYRVVVVGMGKRGMHHATAFQANGRFDVAGVCDIDPTRLDAAAAKFGAAKGTDARQLCASLKPDVFCFCTLPNLRIPMIQAGIEGGARLIAFEKPVALTTMEGFAVKALLDDGGVKAVVSHQHRYGEHYRKVKEIVASGALGRVHTVYGTATGWMTHMLSHLIDYMRWYNAEAPAQWVMAQAAGRGKLADNHPSPDYIAGFVQFANGVRGIYECGAGAPDVPEVDYWWRPATSPPTEAIPSSETSCAAAQTHARPAHTNASPREPRPSSAQCSKPASCSHCPRGHPPPAAKTWAASCGW
jgi:predicted dehydrogenase